MSFLRHSSRFCRACSLSSITHRRIIHPKASTHFALRDSGGFFFQTFRRTSLLHFLTSANNRSFFSTFHYSPLKSILTTETKGINGEKNENGELGVAKIIELVNQAKGLPSKSEAITFLDASGVTPDKSMVSSAIWELKDDWELALLVFEWGEKCGCNDERSLGLIAWVLDTNDKFSVAWSLIRDGHRRSLDVRLPMLIMTERYAAKNSPEMAIRTFDVMENLRLSPDQTAFYTLLHALCENGNAPEAEELMLKKRKLFPLETESFNIILNTWCNISLDVLEAKRIWREMAKNCVIPDSVTYTYMISCFSKVRNLFDSLRLYDEMKKKSFDPNLQVYNSLIYVLVSENCLNEAMRVLGRIKEMGLEPDVESYNSLICPLCEANRFDEARAVLGSMAQAKVHPSRETYYAFLKSDKFEDTLEVLDEIRRSGLGVDGDGFVLIFENLFRSNQPGNALKIWVEMKGYGVEPGAEHYEGVVRGLVSCGCLVKAREIHTEMVSKGFPEDPKLKRLLQEPRRGKNSRSEKPSRIMRRVERVHRGSGSRSGKRRKRGGKGKKKKSSDNNVVV